MSAESPYTEEMFGILTDDDLYLDAIFVRPRQATDKKIKAIRVWVPKYPLTKSSVLTCARQEVQSYGPDGKIAHLVFDLRGTGESDGTPGDREFKLDLAAVKAWAEERFGEKVNFGFFGTPDSKQGRVFLWPLRPSTVMETYHYPPGGSALVPPTVLYLSSYGNFSRKDDAFCTALSQAGYEVYGMDPFRYLLHASASEKLTPQQLWDDLQILCHMLPKDPIIVAQPLAAGLALLWGAGVPNVRGVVAIGRTQDGFAPRHVFANESPQDFLLLDHVDKIAPRPVALVQRVGHPLGGDERQMEALRDKCGDPCRWEKTKSVKPEHLFSLLQWIRTENPVDEDEKEAAETAV